MFGAEAEYRPDYSCLRVHMIASLHLDYVPTCFAAKFARTWRASSIQLKMSCENEFVSAEHLIRTALGFILAVVAACCYVKLAPSGSLVVAVALSAKVASLMSAK
jgi:hypothetical protein